jgi:hypothetical protein
VRLFHPRRQSWKRHFEWYGPVLVGRTQTGRATIAVLDINEPERLDLRRTLIERGEWLGIRKCGRSPRQLGMTISGSCNMTASCSKANQPRIGDTLRTPLEGIGKPEPLKVDVRLSRRNFL